MEKDKLLHAGMCLLLTVWGAAAGVVIGLPFGGALLMGVLLAMGAGLMKEVYDLMDYGVFSLGDLLADVVGAAVGCGLWWWLTS